MDTVMMDRLSLVRIIEAQEMPVFTTQQIATILNINMNSASILIHRLVKKGIFIRVMRGYYCLPSTDIYSIASTIYPNSYVSLLAAFEYYGATTQSPRTVDVVNSMHSGTLNISTENGKYMIRFIKTKSSLIYGFKRVYIGNKVAFIAEKERAVIDGLIFSRYVPLDEVVSAIRSGIDTEKAIKYAKLTGKQAVMKRIGFLLRSEDIKFSPEDFKLTETYVPLDASLPKKGKYDKKWKVIVNTVIE